MASTGEDNLMGDWAELLPDLLILIAKRIHVYEDFVSFGGVCRSWRCVAVKDNFNHTRVQVPWLMLPKQENDYRGFASLSKGGMVHRVFLPEARGKHCISSKGWLISTDRQYNNMELLHPLSRSRIPLPLLESAILFLHMRAVLSANPSFNDDYVVMVIIAPRVYFWKSGNKVWSEVSLHSSYYDIVYYKDQFYAIDTDLRLFLCDTNSGNVRIVGLARVGLARGECAYLVECSGELLVVIREGYNYSCYRRTCSFRVYKYDDSADIKNACKGIDNLGGVSIFVGRSAATAVPATTAAEIKPNCIYFTESTPVLENIYYSYMDVGIYNLESQTIETLPKVARSYNIFFSHIWVTPTF